MPTQLNPVALFVDADIVVQVVMAGLAPRSVWVWTIVVAFSLRMSQVQRGCGKYRDGVLGSARCRCVPQGKRIEGRAERPRGERGPGRMAALDLWARASTAKARASGLIRRWKAWSLQRRTSWQAGSISSRTVGAVAPFVGLFGTVRGIMDSFFNIGAQQNSSLAVVAPGISEALFAAAIGLFAAIPAVIAYNRFSHRVNGFETRLFRFADRFHATLSRELEQ